MTDDCMILPFPLSRRIAKVRRVAEVLARKVGNARGAYWRTEIDRIWEKLEAAGIGPEVIDEQVAGFRSAVQSEIYRRAYEGSGTGSTDPRGAA